MSGWVLKVIDHPEAMFAVEALQRQVWPGNETEIVPVHMLLAAVHNGGLVIGAYKNGSFTPMIAADMKDIIGLESTFPDPSVELLGFVYGFPGLYLTPDGPRAKHCSHMLGVHPHARNQGIGFALKRAQWQLVRHQGLDRITWTYDPLLSRNAHLNIARLGAVCNTYLRNEYGKLRDALNEGLPTDRFQVDWWVNTPRVANRLSKRPRMPLDLAHFLDAEVKIINPTCLHPSGLPYPAEDYLINDENLLLVEIPDDFQALRSVDVGLAMAWRMHSRLLFDDLFGRGYLVTDFVHLTGASARSFYILSHGDSTL